MITKQNCVCFYKILLIIYAKECSNYYTTALISHARKIIFKILQEMGIPDCFICLLRILCADQEATVRTEHGTMDWFQIGKGVHRGCILSPYYLTYMQSTSCKMPGWMKHKLKSRFPGEIWITSNMQMTSPYGRKWRRTKEPLHESERGGWKNWLETQHSKN